MTPHRWRRGRARVEDNGRIATCRRCGWSIEYYGEGFPAPEDLRGCGLNEDCDKAVVESVMES